MATVSNSNLLGSVYRDPPLITLEAGSNTLFFEPGNRQMLMLRNPTGAAISPVISGSASGVIRVGGLVIDTSVGVAIGSIAAGQSVVLFLDTRLEYLRGIVSVTNAAGLIAWTVGFGISDVAGVSAPITGIFGFTMPSTPPTTFPGELIVGTERTATDAAKWSRQNSDAALTIAPAAMSASGAQTLIRYIAYTDETAVAIGDEIAIIAKIESAAGNMSITSSVGSSSNSSNARLGHKQGRVTANAAVAPRLQVSFNAGVAGSFSQMLGFNLTTLLAQKWFIVFTAGQSNWVGAASFADPALDTPVEGCVVFPGATNSYVGAELGKPMLALDPINNQTLNGSSTEYGGGPGGSFLRELRKFVPADYTIVYVATNYAGQGFKLTGEWNRTKAVPQAYNGFWSVTRAVWAAAPVGSVMGGMIFCGGESDLGGTEAGISSTGNMGEWVSSTNGGFPNLLNEIRSETGWDAPKGGGTSYGAIPLVISEIGMDNAASNVANMITLQSRLRTGSGDALERSRCKYVARPAGWTLNPLDAGQPTHFEQPTNRQRGIDVARALRDLVYA